MSENINMGVIAQDYARHFNMHIFPLVPGSKRPLTNNGFKDATNNLSIIANWWEQFPTANIGCATGLISGISVLDIDPKPSAEIVLKNFENKFSTIPQTLQGKSGGGGFHFYFKSKIYLPCRIGIIQGVDFKGDGGYIVLPPSLHENGQFYQWQSSSNISPNLLNEIPDWLIDVVNDSGQSTGVNATTSYKSAASGEYIEEGRRTVSLASIIGYLLSKRVDPNLTKELVLALNELKFRPPLASNEVLKVLNSIAGRELKKRLKREIK